MSARLQHLLLTLQEDHLEVTALRAQTGLKSQSQDLNRGRLPWRPWLTPSSQQGAVQTSHGFSFRGRPAAEG